MAPLIEGLVEWLQGNWVKAVGSLGLLALGWVVGRWRAQQRWRSKEFLDRLNFSLNLIEVGVLRIRTLIEKDCDDVFLNREALVRLRRVVGKTTPEDPLIPIYREEVWYYLNAALNEVSEKFAEGHLRRDNGLAVTTSRYLLCLTNEADGEVRTRKMRVMLIRKELLENLPADAPRLESPSHATRWRTLQQMAKAYRQTPFKFIEVELSL